MSGQARVEFPHGYAGDLAISGGSVWMAWATCETDELTLFSQVNRSWPLRPDVSLETWRDRPPARMALYLACRAPDGGVSSLQQLASGQGSFQGPLLVPGGDGQAPWVVWGEHRPEGYALVAWHKGQQQTVALSPRPMLLPAAATDREGRLCVLWQAADEASPRSFAIYACWLDRESHHLPGATAHSGERISAKGTSSWCPAVAAAADHGVWCAWDAWSGGTYHVMLRRALSPRHWGEPVTLAASAFPDMQPTLAVDPEGRPWVGWVRGAPWGRLDHSLGRMRTIHVQTFDPGTGGIALPAGYDHTGALPIPIVPVHALAGGDPMVSEHLNSMWEEFIVPMAPRLIADDQGVYVIYRSLHTMGISAFGWDLRVLTHTGRGWSAPERLSTAVGFPDTKYGVAAVHDGTLWLGYHACEPPGPRDDGEMPPRPPQLPRYHKHAVTKQRFLVEHVTPAGHSAPPSAVSMRPTVMSITAPRRAQPVHDNRERALDDRRYHLLFGDLHRHSLYSKCFAVNDGQVFDHWRWAVDVAALDFYALTDHVDLMSYMEWKRVNEAATLMLGNAHVFPLYGFEWTRESRHANFFYLDQAVAEALRVACLSSARIDEIWPKLDAWLLPGTVIAIRHHREVHRQPGDLETFAARYEPVIEVLQTRGEARDLGEHFLQHGCRVGFVGASDHSRPGAPFPFCLTGVWAEERSRKGVFDALWRRRTFATNGVKMRIFVSVCGYPMGSEGSTSVAPEVRAEVVGTTPVDQVEFFRNGHLVHVVPVEQQEGVVTFQDHEVPRGTTAYYYVRVVQRPERPGIRPDCGIAFSSPVWLAVR